MSKPMTKGKSLHAVVLETGCAWLKTPVTPRHPLCTPEAHKVTHKQFPPTAGNFCLQPKSQQEAPIPGHGIGNYSWIRWMLGKRKALKKSGQSSALTVTKSQTYLLRFMLGEA